jgi:hypothetical protein
MTSPASWRLLRDDVSCVMTSDDVGEIFGQPLARTSNDANYDPEFIAIKRSRVGAH